MTPKVSVVVPIYNASDHLGECLDSILLQTHENIEVVCIDDGSTDDSLDILQGYAMFDERLKVITQENAGPGAARNRGIQEATGDFIIFLDSDDFFDSAMLEKMVAKAQEDNSDIVICGHYLFNDTTKKVTKKGDINDEFLDKSPFQPDELGDKLFTLRNPASWNKLIRTDLIRQNDIAFDEEARCIEDTIVVCLSLACARKISIIDEAFVYYRINQDTQITHNLKNYFPDFLIAMSHLYDRLKQMGLVDRFLTSYLICVKQIMGWILKSCPIDKRRENLNLIKKYLPLEVYDRLFFCPAPHAKISIIIPAYNAAEFLPECLDSCLNQTLKEIEIICVDDGSTDNSLEILNEYAKKDNRIIVLQQKNQRQAIARNTAMEVATGQFVQFLDADDFMEPDTCECLFLYSELFSLDMCQCAAKEFKHNTKKEFENPYHCLTWYTDQIPTVFCAEMVQNILPQMAVTAWLTFYRRDFLIRNNIKWINKKIAYEDTAFFIESILKAGRVGALKEPFYHRRVHAQATTQQMATNFCDYAEIIKYTLDIIKKISLNERIFTLFAYTLLQKAWDNFSILPDQSKIQQAPFMYDLAFQIMKKYHLPLVDNIPNWCQKYLTVKGTKKDKWAFKFYAYLATWNKAKYEINLITIQRKPVVALKILGIPVWSSKIIPIPPTKEDIKKNIYRQTVLSKFCGLTIFKIQETIHV